MSGFNEKRVPDRLAMLQEDEITEAIHALREQDLDLLTLQLRRCGNTILKREHLKTEVARLSARSLSRITLWQHKFDEQAPQMARETARALRKGHLRYGIDDNALALNKGASARHVTGQSLIDDAQAMLPQEYVIYATHDGPQVSVVLSTAVACCVQ